MIGLRIAQETDFSETTRKVKSERFWVLNRHIFPKTRG